MLLLVMERNEKMEAFAKERNITVSTGKGQRSSCSASAMATRKRMLLLMLPHLQFRIHSHDTAHEVPVALVSHPVTHHNTGAPIT